MKSQPQDVQQLRASDPDYFSLVFSLVPLGMWVAIRTVYPPDFTMGPQLELQLLFGTVSALGGMIAGHVWWQDHRAEICFDLAADSAKHWRLLLWQVAALVGFSLPLLLTARTPLPKFPSLLDVFVLACGFMAALLRVVHFNWMRGLARESYFFRQTQKELHHAP